MISNINGLPIYEQIREQIKAAIMSGEIKEGEMLPSIRALAKDLRVSVISTMRAYSDLEQEGFVAAMPGKGSYVLPQNPDLWREQKLREIEEALKLAIACSRAAQVGYDELCSIIKALMEDE